MGPLVDGECRSELFYWFISEVAFCVVGEFIGLWLVPTLAAEGCCCGAASALISSGSSALASAEGSGAGLLAAENAGNAGRISGMAAIEAVRNAARANSATGTITVTRQLGGVRAFSIEAVREAETVVVDRVGDGVFRRTFRLGGTLYYTSATQEEWKLYLTRMEQNAQQAWLEAEQAWSDEFEEVVNEFQPRVDERLLNGALNEEKVIASIQQKSGCMPREDCEIVAEKILRHGGLDDAEAYYMDRNGM